MSMQDPYRSGDDIRAKAKMLSEKLGYEKRINFSNGWLQHFKRRNDLLWELENNRLISETEHHLTIVRTYIQSRGASDDIYNCLHEMEQMIAGQKWKFFKNSNQNNKVHFFYDEKLNMQPSGKPRNSWQILGDQKFR